MSPDATDSQLNLSTTPAKKSERVDGIRTAAFDWAKTILAPVVGFASAAIGYYYGTRSAGEGSASRSDDAE